MRIAVLSRGAEIHSTSRLLAAGRARGHHVDVIPILESVIQLDDAGSVVLIAGEPVPEPDGLIARIGTFLPEFAQNLLLALERPDRPQINRLEAINRSRNKFESLTLLARRGLPVPRTLYLKDLDQIDGAVRSFGDAPVIIKPVVGTKGRGVIRADSPASAASILESMILLSREVLLQEYVEQAAGQDLRLLVLDGEVIAAVRRTAADGGFRANWHQGATLEGFEPSETLRRVAVLAAGTTGLEFAGVDIVESSGGPKILEVNSSPGFQGTERATGIDIATRLIESLERG